MIKNYLITARALIIVVFSSLIVSCGNKYDHIDKDCKDEFIEGKDKTDLETIKNYLKSINKYNEYQLDSKHSLYWHLNGSGSVGDPDSAIDMYSSYDIEYEAYLLDGTKKKKETLFDSKRALIQPYLGPYNKILKGFVGILSKVDKGKAGESTTIDFYLTSNGAFATCGWPYSPYGVEVPPNTPVHFIVTIHF